MADPGIVQRLQPQNCLRQYRQNLVHREISFPFRMLRNFLIEIATIRVLHDHAEALGARVNERLLVFNDIRMIHARQQPDLVQRILLVLVVQVQHFHLL